MIHHGTIRKYAAALLDLFNGLEIQYTDSNGTTISRNIPIKYSTREKIAILDTYTAEQLASGNTNVLPRASLALSTLIKADQRVTNKNNKIGIVKTPTTYEYMYNSVPYEFTFELAIVCRGMNEACMVIEQIAPKFNPTVNIDIWDASNLDEPTRIPVKLLDIGIESDEYEELSSNLVTVNVGLSLMGNLYPTIKETQKIKEFKMYMNESNGGFFKHSAILGWDVADGVLSNETLTEVMDTADYPPVIIDVVTTDVVAIGTIDLSVIYEDADNKLSELTFDWTVVLGNATIAGNLDRAQLTINGAGTIEIQVTITDYHGNYATLAKTFNVL